jgi:hypothetical protein
MTDARPTPPTEFDPNHPDLFIDRPRWPTVVGIISISWSGLNLLCGIAFVGFFVWMNSASFTQMTEKGMGSPMPDVMRPNTLALVLMGVGTLWVGVLMFAGITTLARKDAGRMLHLLYAVVAIVLSAVGLVMQAKQNGAIRAWAEANPDTKWAQQQRPLGQFFGLMCGMGWGLAYPLFLIVWFGVVKGKEKIG